jgi:hypothetical protein
MEIHRVSPRSMPELWTEGVTLDSALRQLAERLMLALDSVTDHFHGEPVRQAIGDVSRLLASLPGKIQPDRLRSSGAPVSTWDDPLRC